MKLAKRILRRFRIALLRRTDSIGYARALGVTVGSSCRLLNVSFSSEPYLVSLGDHVSASSTHFETHDGGVWVLRHLHPDIDVIRPIRVGSNVYLGYRSMVMPGVTIGDNVVVGAGAIVTRDIPSNSVAVGAPARVIKTLDDYSVKVLSDCQPTKRLTNEQKRDWYEKMFTNA